MIPSKTNIEVMITNELLSCTIVFQNFYLSFVLVGQVFKNVQRNLRKLHRALSCKPVGLELRHTYFNVTAVACHITLDKCIFFCRHFWPTGPTH